MVNFSLNRNTELSSVAIKVKDFDRMLSFYQQVVGLDILSEENDMAMLGVKEPKHKLLELISTPEGVESKSIYSGLNHMSFVFPNREDLALFIKHLMYLNYPIEGQSDHGFCESIYINDPENNRLEFSWDKPKSEWPIISQNSLDSQTKVLCMETFIGRISGHYKKIPVQTKLGHVHLSVSSLPNSRAFYINQLGFSDKESDYQSVSFLSTDDYYHQIVMNEWLPNKTEIKVENSVLGLDYIVFHVPHLNDLIVLKENLEVYSAEFYFNLGKNILAIEDPNGIQLWFIANNK